MEGRHRVFPPWSPELSGACSRPSEGCSSSYNLFLFCRTRDKAQGITPAPTPTCEVDWMSVRNPKGSLLSSPLCELRGSAPLV